MSLWTSFLTLWQANYHVGLATDFAATGIPPKRSPTQPALYGCCLELFRVNLKAFGPGILPMNGSGDQAYPSRITCEGKTPLQSTGTAFRQQDIDLVL
ncbi:hypothetical protein EV361DRAFT_913973 [Lentinula raphanica]|nr:hypothetical protein EV361DRAFT_913973 [Lentinula raphanica]